MKYLVAGQKKESFFHKRKNRIVLGPVIAIVTAFLLPFVFGYEHVFDWKTLFQFLVLFTLIELISSYLNKEEKAEGLIALDFKDDSIELSYFSGDITVLDHNQIQAIHKDVTKIVIDVRNKKKVYGIPYSYFGYDDVQKMKIDVDRVSQKISSLPKENPAFS